MGMNYLLNINYFQDLCGIFQKIFSGANKYVEYTFKNYSPHSLEIIKTLVKFKLSYIFYYKLLDYTCKYKQCEIFIPYLFLNWH